MALRDKIAANAQPYLQPGENIQGVLAGQTASQYWILLAYIVFLIKNRYRTIVATDRRIIVFDAGAWSMTKTKSIVGELPRNHRLGPWDGNIWYRHQLGNETLRIHRRFKSDIETIDGPAAMPPPPAQQPTMPPPTAQPPTAPPPSAP